MSTTASDGKSEAQGTRKTLYLIRHAESEENRRLASLQSVVRSVWNFSWPDSADVAAAFELSNVPGQVDTPLSSRGNRQVEGMRSQLEAADFLTRHGVELVLHSPLQRARDTCLGLFPPPSETSSDPRWLVEETELLLEKTPMEWILSSSFYSRLQEFVSAIQCRPETRIVAVGHSQFFRAMLHQGFKFENCDVWHVELSSTSAAPSPPGTATSMTTSWKAFLNSALKTNAAGKESTEAARREAAVDYSVPLPWSNLRKVLTCDSIAAENDKTDGSSTFKKDKDA